MRSYGQYCGLAKALDHVGDRWTLLVVRELLVGPRRYSQLKEALPGVATNLLADRLRQLQSDGIIDRLEDEGRYVLTESGRGLEKAVHELVRWGAQWMGPREPNEAFQPEWLLVALAALLPNRRSSKIEIHAGDVVFGINRGRVAMGPVPEPDAVVQGSPELVLAVAAGKLPISVLDIHGDRAAAEKALTAS